jgi:UDP-N-acetylglucosamine/UDP-N-acetylgalactosamine diphosphorylase
MKEEELVLILKNYNQYHVLDHYQGLSGDKKSEFLKNLRDRDFDLLFRLHNQFRASEGLSGHIRDMRPAAAMTVPKTKTEKRRMEKARSTGEALIREGKVAVLIVAGGQGSRLGYDGPKGIFPISPVKNKPLFQLFAEQIRALAIRYSVEIPLLIMTSQENHRATMDFFELNNFYDLDKKSVYFFQQGMLPSITPKGKLLLDDELHLLSNPDGHGGSLKALHDSGLLKKLINKGFQELFYCQVDNPLVRMADPVFLGYHAMTGAEVSTKVVRRSSIEEKVGVYMSVDGKDAIIEYSDLGPEYMSALDENGEILYWAGNTAIHIFSLSFIERLNRHGFALPYHCARKTVEYPVKEKLIKKIDLWKCEAFVFDAIPLATKACCMEVLRREEFSPVKNKEGADSPDRARAAMSKLHTSWLTGAGVAVPPGTQVEISPLYALDEEELLTKLKKEKPAMKDHLYLG